MVVKFEWIPITLCWHRGHVASWREMTFDNFKRYTMTVDIIKQSTMMNGPSSSTSTRLAAVFVDRIRSWNIVHEYHSEEKNETKALYVEKQLIPAPRRFGAAIKLLPLEYQRYRQLHDNVWPQVHYACTSPIFETFPYFTTRKRRPCFNTLNGLGTWQAKSLTRREEQALFEKDMNAIASDPVTREWWMECEPCQEPFSQWLPGSLPLSKGGKGDWWAPMECVCHCGYWPTQYGNVSNDPDFVKLI